MPPINGHGNGSGAVLHAPSPRGRPQVAPAPPPPSAPFPGVPRAAGDRQIIRLRRTPTPDNPPTGLAEGEPSVEMAEPRRLWIGVPTSIEPSGRILIGGASIYARVADPFTPPAEGDTVQVRVDNAEALSPGLVLQVEGITYIVQVIVGSLVTILRVASEPPPSLGPGIVDGSNVSPGDIGEYLQTAVLPAAPFIISAGSAIGLQNIVLGLTMTPGDWELNGYIQGRSSSGSGGTFQIGLTDDQNLFATFIRASTVIFGTAPNVTTFTFPGRRFNITQPLLARATITLAANLSHDTEIWGYMAARRIR